MSPAQRLKSRRATVTKVARKSPKSFLKLALLFLALLFVVFCAFKLYLSWQQRLWVSSNRITVVVASKSPKIYSYNPVTGKLTIIEIPENTQIDASNSYGNWLAGGLWAFGYQEDKKGELLRSSLQKSLDLPIDGWVEEKGVNLFEAKPLSWISAFYEVLTSGPSKTNLTFFDKLALLVKVSMIQSSDRQTFDLVKSGVVEKTKLSDGSDGHTVSSEKAKAVLQFLHDDKVFSEAQRVVVVNTTKESGLATNVAAVIGTLGVRVIGTQSSSEDIKGCFVRGNKIAIETLSAQRLHKLFNCKLEVVTSTGAEDLQLVLGADFAKGY